MKSMVNYCFLADILFLGCCDRLQSSCIQVIWYILLHSLHLPSVQTSCRVMHTSTICTCPHGEKPLAYGPGWSVASLQQLADNPAYKVMHTGT